jgi:hypothetical protein
VVGASSGRGSAREPTGDLFNPFEAAADDGYLPHREAVVVQEVDRSPGVSHREKEGDCSKIMG